MNDVIQVQQIFAACCKKDTHVILLNLFNLGAVSFLSSSQDCSFESLLNWIEGCNSRCFLQSKHFNHFAHSRLLSEVEERERERERESCVNKNTNLSQLEECRNLFTGQTKFKKSFFVAIFKTFVKVLAFNTCS